jgi:hypothetical protein
MEMHCSFLRKSNKKSNVNLFHHRWKKKKKDKEAAQFQKHYGSPSMLMKSATK